MTLLNSMHHKDREHKQKPCSLFRYIFTLTQFPNKYYDFNPIINI